MSNYSPTPEQLRHHYEVERELADRLRRSTRAERPLLFKTLYEEMFQRVPNHPRIVRRDTDETMLAAVSKQMALLKPHLPGVKNFLEFAPGDARLSFEVCRHVEHVYAVDISDQTGGSAQVPSNFHLTLYDGFHLDLPANLIDLAFSYQLIEHLHPDDVEDHFRTIHRLLRPGGAYVFSTPHRFSGPHDVSQYFSDVPQGFHLKEWTFRELAQVAEAAGYSASYPIRLGKPRKNPVWNVANNLLEAMVGALPRKLQKRIALRLFQGVAMVTYKAAH